MTGDTTPVSRAVPGSRLAASAAIRISMTQTREEERIEIERQRAEGFLVAAVDFGGEFLASVSRMVERAVVAAHREGLIGGTHAEEGAVAGAAREAISQIMSKAIGFNVGGKIGIARFHDHVAVCAFFGIGLLHLNEVAIGLGHRAV
ncbi:MAG: HutP family protein [Clostridia bacterium]|nr:HutP family protein [Clostridia bacterium]